MSLNPSTIFEAAAAGDLLTIAKLMADPAQRTAVNDHGLTPVHLAARGGHTDAVRLLIALGASADTPALFSQRMAAHEAAAGGHTETLNVLSQLVPDSLSALDHQGRTPANLAVIFGHRPAYEALLSAGALLAGPQTDPTLAELHRAAAMGDVQKMIRLLNADADPSARLYFGQTPLHLAVRFNRLDVIRLLQGAGADPHAVDRRGHTPYSPANAPDRTMAPSIAPVAPVERPEHPSVIMGGSRVVTHRVVTPPVPGPSVVIPQVDPADTATLAKVIAALDKHHLSGFADLLRCPFTGRPYEHHNGGVDFPVKSPISGRTASWRAVVQGRSKENRPLDPFPEGGGAPIPRNFWFSDAFHRGDAPHMGLIKSVIDACRGLPDHEIVPAAWQILGPAPAHAGQQHLTGMNGLPQTQYTIPATRYDPPETLPATNTRPITGTRAPWEEATVVASDLPQSPGSPQNLQKTLEAQQGTPAKAQWQETLVSASLPLPPTVRAPELKL